MIAINRNGGINSFSLYSAEESNGNWGLGYITADGFYVGYLSTKESRNESNLIRVLTDGDSLTLFSDFGTYTNRVAFLRITETQARAFEEAYNECGGCAYCKGRNSSNKSRRQAKHDSNDNSQN